MSILTITVETLQAGQPRAYADSIYEAILTVSKDDNPNLDYDPGIIKNFARVLIRDFNDKESREWWQGRLDVFEKLGKGKWRIKIIEPYTD